MSARRSILRRRGWSIAATGAALAAAIGVPAAAAPTVPDARRGEMLYENHCIGCHDSLLHVRQDRHATSYVAVGAKVRFWSDLQRLGWTEQDIGDVTRFLDARYYHFETRPPDPATPSGAPAAGATPR
jgi:hypothetical protein